MRADGLKTARFAGAPILTFLEDAC